MPDSLREQLQESLGAVYTIERELGRGGMATVFLARDVKHHHHVALKVLDRQLAASLGTERFLAEIRITANLQHPNVLPLFDSDVPSSSAPVLSGAHMRREWTKYSPIS